MCPRNRVMSSRDGGQVAATLRLGYFKRCVVVRQAQMMRVNDSGDAAP